MSIDVMNMTNDLHVFSAAVVGYQDSRPPDLDLRNFVGLGCSSVPPHGCCHVNVQPQHLFRPYALYLPGPVLESLRVDSLTTSAVPDELLFNQPDNPAREHMKPRTFRKSSVASSRLTRSFLTGCARVDLRPDTTVDPSQFLTLSVTNMTDVEQPVYGAYVGAPVK
jgi:hypothetical protein